LLEWFEIEVPRFCKAKGAGQTPTIGRTKEMVGQIIRHRFLDPDASAEVTAKKLHKLAILLAFGASSEPSATLVCKENLACFSSKNRDLRRLGNRWIRVKRSNAGPNSASVIGTSTTKCKPYTISLTLTPTLLLKGPSEDYGNEEHTTVAAFLPWRGS
jgi:hypothetical protein